MGDLVGCVEGVYIYFAYSIKKHRGLLCEVLCCTCTHFDNALVLLVEALFADD